MPEKDHEEFLAGIVSRIVPAMRYLNATLKEIEGFCCVSAQQICYHYGIQIALQHDQRTYLLGSCMAW